MLHTNAVSPSPPEQTPSYTSYKFQHKTIQDNTTPNETNMPKVLKKHAVTHRTSYTSPHNTVQHQTKTNMPKLQKHNIVANSQHPSQHALVSNPPSVPSCRAANLHLRSILAPLGPTCQTAWTRTFTLYSNSRLTTPRPCYPTWRESIKI